MTHIVQPDHLCEQEMQHCNVVMSSKQQAVSIGRSKEHKAKSNHKYLDLDEQQEELPSSGGGGATADDLGRNGAGVYVGEMRAWPCMQVDPLCCIEENSCRVGGPVKRW